MRPSGLDQFLPPVGRLLLRVPCTEVGGQLVAHVTLPEATWPLDRDTGPWSATLVYALDEIASLDCDENRSVRRAAFFAATAPLLTTCRGGAEGTLAGHFFQAWEPMYVEHAIAERSGLVDDLFAQQITALFDGDATAAAKCIYALFSRARREERVNGSLEMTLGLRAAGSRSYQRNWLEITTPGAGKVKKPFTIRLHSYICLPLFTCSEERAPYPERGRTLVDLQVTETQYWLIERIRRLGLAPPTNGQPLPRLDRVVSRILGLPIAPPSSGTSASPPG